MTDRPPPSLGSAPLDAATKAAPWRAHGWLIGGLDPSGAAGLAADLRAFAGFSVHGSVVATALTAQGLGRVFALGPVGPEEFAAQLNSLLTLPPPAAVKSGLLGQKHTVLALAAALGKTSALYVLDPVLHSTSGVQLIDAETLAAAVRELLPRATLVTPNADEAAALTGLAVETAADMPLAAAAIRRLGAKAVLVKGGHIGPQGVYCHDYYEDETTHFWLTTPRTRRKTPDASRARGTGCTLAAAITAALCRGEELADAVVIARAYVATALAHATPLLGQDPTEPMPLPIVAWPPEHAVAPWVTSDRAVQPRQFPEMEEPVGFYPVVPDAAWVRRLAAAGAKMVQLRVKDLEGPLLARELRSGIEAARELGVRLFVNDHWALAIELGAYGVHLGQEDLGGADLAAIARAGLRLGISTHSYRELAVAEALAPSYIALGPIFETTCKSMRFGPQGMGRLKEWRALTRRPLVAIGGLKLEHIGAALAAGADGVAVISAITAAADPESQCHAWLQAVSGLKPR